MEFIRKNLIDVFVIKTDFRKGLVELNQLKKDGINKANKALDDNRIPKEKLDDRNAIIETESIYVITFFYSLTSDF